MTIPSESDAENLFRRCLEALASGRDLTPSLEALEGFNPKLAASAAQIRDRIAGLRAELDTAESELRLERQSAGPKRAALIVGDEDAVIQDITHSLCDMFGRQTDELVGRFAWSLLAPGPGPRRNQFTELVHQVRRHKGWDGRISCLRKDGATFWTHLLVLPWRRVEPVTQWLFILEDVTSERRMEADLKKAEAAAEVAVKSKSRFLAKLSHGLRTPLNGLLGVSELLLDSGLSDEQQVFAEIIHGSAVSLSEVAAEILDISKIEEGRLVLKTQDFNLRDVAESVADQLAPRIHKKGLELILRIHPNVEPWVIGDQERVAQILHSLVDNAAKFTQTGEIMIRISRVYISEKWQTIEIQVSDTGIGIPAPRLETLFELSPDADPMGVREHQGMGLGLAITHQIVTAMGGHITVTSRVDKGSTFCVDLPFQLQAPDHQHPRFPDLSLGDVQVLIVGRNDSTRHAIREQLLPWGCLPREVSNGFQALSYIHAMADSAPFQVVFLDDAIPGLDPGDLVQRVKNNPKIRGAYIILLNSNQDPTTRVSPPPVVDAVLSKPVKLAHLFEVMVTYLETFGGEEDPVRELDSGSGPDQFRILVAEDNPVNQKITSRLLQRGGYQCDIVGNGREALAAVKRTYYHLILMDCQMPEMDGYEATQRIRDFERGKRHTPIVAMTIRNIKGDREQCLAAGMDDYFPKPIFKKELYALLERYLKNAKPGTEQEGMEVDAPKDQDD